VQIIPHDVQALRRYKNLKNRQNANFPCFFPCAVIYFQVRRELSLVLM